MRRWEFIHKFLKSLAVRCSSWNTEIQNNNKAPSILHDIHMNMKHTYLTHLSSFSMSPIAILKNNPYISRVNNENWFQDLIYKHKKTLTRETKLQNLNFSVSDQTFQYSLTYAWATELCIQSTQATWYDIISKVTVCKSLLFCMCIIVLGIILPPPGSSSLYENPVVFSLLVLQYSQQLSRDNCFICSLQ